VWGVILWGASVGCVDVAAPLPTCTEGRSRCVTQVALGARFGCAALRDTTVWCWGRNDESQLGYPTTDLCTEELASGQTRAVACHTFPFQVVGLDHAVRVATGAAFACAQRDDGTVRCWGSNVAGQLGNGLTLPSQSPVGVRGLGGVTALAAGQRHACAISAGRVYCWGANDRGQLGLATGARTCATADGPIPCEPEPTLVQGLEGVTALSAGAAHTCALASEGITLCWGDGRFGQTGAGSARGAPGPMPQPVLAGDLPLAAVRDVAAMAHATCARADDGAVWCWGRNDHGELGVAPTSAVPDGCAGPCDPEPARVPGLDRREAPDAAVDAADGAVERDAATPDAPEEPIDVAPVRDALAPPSMVPRGLAAGATFACAVLDDSTVRCWGDDTDAQLGDGRRVRDPQRPVMVIATPGAARTNPLQGVASVAAGAASACALLGDGSLRCWGSNVSGALGNGTTSAQSGPVPVTW
jgi:hypothetical protein